MTSVFKGGIGMFGCNMFANQSFSHCFAGAGTSAPVTVIADTATKVVVSVFVAEIAEK